MGVAVEGGRWRKQKLGRGVYEKVIKKQVIKSILELITQS